MDYSKLLLGSTFLLILGLVHSEQIQWENETGICTRCGCNIKDEVFNMNCTNKGIQQSLANWPDIPSGVDKLVAIFSHNEINRLEPLSSIDGDLVVYYDHCSIKELSSGLFENCKNITYVDLSYNSIKGEQLTSDVFKGPYNNTAYEPIALEYLNLAYNEIHSIEKNLFEHMPNLKWLNLEGNDFRVLDLQTRISFANLKHLQYLNLARNELVHIPEDALKPLIKLDQLDISFNKLDFVPQAIADVAQTLRTLILDENPILDLTDESFLGMDWMTHISARNMKNLLNIKTNTFAPMTKLKKLDLSGLNNTTIEDEAFGQISNLRELNLSYSNLKQLHPNLLDWSKLQILDLKYNKFYCECDLYNISMKLNEGVRRDKNGPYCYDYKRYQHLEIYTLTDDICSETDDYENWSNANSFSDFKVMRMSLLLLSVILIVCVGVAMWCGYTKYLTQRRNKAYPFASSVIYNPLNTSVQ